MVVAAYRVERLRQIHKYEVKVLVLFSKFLLQLSDSKYNVNGTTLGPVATLVLRLKALGQNAVVIFQRLNRCVMVVSLKSCGTAFAVQMVPNEVQALHQIGTRLLENRRS